MLDNLIVEEDISKEEYSQRLSELEPTLFYLEWKAREAKIPTLILLEGLVATGKGDALRTLTERLDPRSLRVHPMKDPRGVERDRPWLWRFWMRLPNHGEMAVFDTSWYRHVLDDRVKGEIKNKELEARLSELMQLERTLLDDGTVLVKLWFHISKKEQLRRLKRADKDTTDFWDVSPEEWEQNEDYKKWKKVASEILTATSSEQAPWHIIDCENPRRSRVKVFETIAAAMQAQLDRVAPQLTAGPAPVPKPPPSMENGALAQAEPKEERA
jgi:AMP-polyphosphate phosphotransferase